MADAPTKATVENSLGNDKQPTLHSPTWAHREHCSATPAVLSDIGREVDHQVRLKHTATGESALYTVSEVEEVAEPDAATRPPPRIVRMGPDGLNRLGDTITVPFDATVDPKCVDLTLTFGPPNSDPDCALMLTDEEEDAKSDIMFTERVCDDGVQTGLVVVAPHGGVIEQHTDDQAVRVAATLKARGVSLWLCKGWKPDGSEEGWASDHWHITSTEIHEESFPGLKVNDLISRGFQHAVSFHGFKEPDPGGPHVCIGGITPEDTTLLGDIQMAIKNVLPSDMTVEVYTDATASTTCEKYSGNDPDNIVHRLGTNGVQIEQSKHARDDHWEAVACAVAGAYASRL
jgi:phage replication-related protein YjqB (UPF0714/DUF867 family)